MDMKSIIMDAATKQADDMKNMMMDHIGSEEMSDKIATAINKKIDIPFVSEDKEQVFFEKVVDVVTDIVEGIFKD
tara:strand:- start:3090 stop:3314 length:225 start_codon:yes stop_codon:yes gene_type:complete